MILTAKLADKLADYKDIALMIQESVMMTLSALKSNDVSILKNLYKIIVGTLDED